MGRWTLSIGQSGSLETICLRIDYFAFWSMVWACSKQFAFQYLPDHFDFWIMGRSRSKHCTKQYFLCVLGKHISWHIICMLQTWSHKSVTIDSWFLALAIIWPFTQNWNLSTVLKKSQDLTLIITCKIFALSSYIALCKMKTQEEFEYCWKLLKPPLSGLGRSSLNRIPLTVARLSHPHCRFFQHQKHIRQTDFCCWSRVEIVRLKFNHFLLLK